MDRTRYDAFKTLKNEHGNAAVIEEVLFDGGFGAGPEQELDEYMVDVHLLSEASGLVGKFSSDMDTLAYSLMTAKATPGEW
jgi:hypothetical protein